MFDMVGWDAEPQKPPLHTKKGRINTAFVFTRKSSKKRIFERFGLMIMYPDSQMLIFMIISDLPGQYQKDVVPAIDPSGAAVFPLWQLPCSIYCSKIIAVLKSLTSSTRTKVGG